MQYIGSSLIPDLIGNTIAAVFFLSGSYAFIYGVDLLMQFVTALRPCNFCIKASYHSAQKLCVQGL